VGKTEQGDQQYTWQMNVSAMGNPLFRRVDIKVTNADGVQLASLIGVVSRP
jgi:hypothetical protein